MGHKTQNTKHKTQSLKIVETHQQCMMISNTMKVVTVAFCIVTPILGANPIIQRIERETIRAESHGRHRRLARFDPQKGVCFDPQNGLTLTPEDKAAFELIPKLEKHMQCSTLTLKQLRGPVQKTGKSTVAEALAAACRRAKKVCKSNQNKYYGDLQKILEGL